MNEIQKLKRKFRQSKEWKSFRGLMKKKAGNIDAITLKPLRKGFQVHHQNLDETKYNELIPEHFICVNIIDRIKAEMERMKEINKAELQ